MDELADIIIEFTDQLPIQDAIDSVLVLLYLVVKQGA